MAVLLKCYGSCGNKYPREQMTLFTLSGQTVNDCKELVGQSSCPHVPISKDIE